MKRMRRWLATASVVVTVTAALTAGPAVATPSGCSTPVVAFPPPDSTTGPFSGAFGVTQGPGGTWYAHGGTINRVQAGVTQEFPVPDAAEAGVGWLTFDPTSGLIWFADRGTGRLGTMDARGRVHEWQIPDGANGQAIAQGIVVGPGPHVWFTDQQNDRIGDLDTTSEGFTMHAIPTTGGFPLALTRGPDGNLWFTERLGDKVGRMTPNGVFTEWDLQAGAFANRIAVGSDGALWFTELFGGAIGRITTSGDLEEIPIGGGPVGLTLGSDGHLYAALWFAHQVAELDAQGHVARAWDVTGSLQVAASQGAIWTTDPFTDSVTRIRTECLA